MTIPLTLRSAKGSNLTYQEVDANLVALRAGIEAKLGMTVVAWTQDPITFDLTLEMSNGDLIGPIRLPPRPVNVLGQWIATSTLKEGDVVTDAGSSYMVAVDHVAGVLVDDIAAGKLELLAGAGAAGPPGIGLSTNDRGTYDPENGYTRNDSVFHMSGGKWRVWLAMDNVGPGIAPGTSDLWGEILSGGSADGGASGPSVDRYRLERLGQVPVGMTLIGKLPVPQNGSLKTTSPCGAILGVAPGAGKSVTVAIHKNGGPAIGSVIITNSNLGGFIAVDYPLVAGDILNVYITAAALGPIDVTALIQIENA